MPQQHERDPRNDPQPGDILSKPGSRGSRYKRIVVERGESQLIYKTHSDGVERTCWLSTWMDWARNADVELYKAKVRPRSVRPPK